MLNKKREAAIDRIQAGLRNDANCSIMYDPNHRQKPGDGFKVTVTIGDKSHDAFIGVSGGIMVYNDHGSAYRGDKAIEKLNLWLAP